MLFRNTGTRGIHTHNVRKFTLLLGKKNSLYTRPKREGRKTQMNVICCSLRIFDSWNVAFDHLEEHLISGCHSHCSWMHFLEGRIDTGGAGEMELWEDHGSGWSSPPSATVEEGQPHCSGSQEDEAWQRRHTGKDHPSIFHPLIQYRVYRLGKSSTQLNTLNGWRWAFLIYHTVTFKRFMKYM